MTDNHDKGEYTTTIVDLPMQHLDEDMLGANVYQDALIDYLTHADTPITIAVQGEWGCGKSSMINVVKDVLCDGGNSLFYGVLVNVWQFDLTNQSSEQTVANILNSIIIQLKNFSLNSDINKKVDAATKLVLTAFAKNMVSRIGLKDSLIDGLIKIFKKEKSPNSNIEQLKDSLQLLVEELQGYDDRKRGCIVFIDNLDRVNPVLAVEILEIIKNIFDFKNLILVVAVDYDVIVKGLEPKLGKLNSQNESEFRHYFDKLIQLQFNIPVAYFNVRSFLKNHLECIALFEFKELDGERQIYLLSKLTKIVDKTIGNNPRSLKRVVNTLSLADAIRRTYVYRLDLRTKASEVAGKISKARYQINMVINNQYAIIADIADAVVLSVQEALAAIATAQDLINALNSNDSDSDGYSDVVDRLNSAYRNIDVLENNLQAVLDQKVVRKLVFALTKIKEANDILLTSNVDEIHVASTALGRAIKVVANLEYKQKVADTLEKVQTLVDALKKTEAAIQDLRSLEPFASVLDPKTVSLAVKMTQDAVKILEKDCFEVKTFLNSLDQVVVTVKDAQIALSAYRHALKDKKPEAVPGCLPVDNKIIIFILVCIQISYPKLYRFVISFPNFLRWDINLANRNNLPKVDYKLEQYPQTKIVLADNTHLEEWKFVLWRFCQLDAEMKQSFRNIVDLLDMIASMYGEKFGKVITDDVELLALWIGTISSDKMRYM